MRFPLTMFAVAAVSFGAGFAAFRTRTGSAVANVIEVASWRLPSAGSGEDRRASAQKLDDLLALTKKPATLARDRALFAAINALTAQDFRTLSTDVLALRERFEKLPRDLQGMLAEATMDRWLEVDADGAMTWVKAARSIAETALKGNQSLERGNAAFDGLLNALARRQPDWLLGLARETPTKLGREAAVQSAIAQLANSDIEGARQKIAAFDQEADRSAATQGLLQCLMTTDPVAAATLVLSFPEGEKRDRGIFQVMFAAGESGSVAFARAFRFLPSEQRGVSWAGFSSLARSQPAMARQLLDEFVTQDRFAARTPYDSQVVGASLGGTDAAATAKWIAEWTPEMTAAMGPALRHGFVRSWAASDPTAALAWAIEQPLNPSAAVTSNNVEWANDDPVQTGLRQWLVEDRTAASAWIEALPPGATRQRANQTLAENYLKAGDAAGAALAYAAGAASDTRGELAQRVASAFANKDAPAAADWALTLPAGAARASAIKSTATAWLAKDPGATVAWFGEMSPGADRDAGASALAAATIHADPSAAVEWVGQIIDPKARADAAAAVFGTWTWTDPQGARAWLRDLNGVDEHWKETFLRRAR